MLAAHDTSKEKYEYDDTNTPERIVNLVLLLMYLAVLVYNIVYGWRMQKDNNQFLKRHGAILMLIIVALISRYGSLTKDGVFLRQPLSVVPYTTRRTVLRAHTPGVLYVHLSHHLLLCVSVLRNVLQNVVSTHNKG